jgi:hypothetical protein
MVLVALSTTALDIVVRGVLAVLAYDLCLQLSGGANVRQLRSLLGSLRRR